MLEVMNELPLHVAGFRAKGQVTKHDYEKVLIPAVDRVAKQFGYLHFLMVLDTDVKNFTLGAWMDDAKVGLKHYTKWRKMAFVTDQEGVKTFSEIFGIVVPGKLKTFSHNQLEEAIEWVSDNTNS